MNKLLLLLLLLGFLIILPACPTTTDPEEESCKVNVANSTITVSSNSDVSGEEGTHITPDIILSSSITSNEAEVGFTVHKVGNCHEIIDYGHVWSNEFATPTVENASQSNFGSNVNFHDEVKTLMTDLIGNRKYYVRAYVKVIDLDQGNEKVLYNDIISSFTTLAECVNGDILLLDDSDKKVINYYYPIGEEALRLTFIVEKTAVCDDGGYNSDVPQNNVVIIKRLSSLFLSDFDYEIYYKLYGYDEDNVIALIKEWVFFGSISDLEYNDEQKIFLNNYEGSFSDAEINIVINPQ